MIFYKMSVIRCSFRNILALKKEKKKKQPRHLRTETFIQTQSNFLGAETTIQELLSLQNWDLVKVPRKGLAQSVFL